MPLSLPLAALAETLVSAFAGLLGVVVGALLTWWRERERERERRRGETLSAARLVDSELEDTLARIEAAVGPDARPTKDVASSIDTPAWAETRAALALGLTPEQWGAVRDAFATVAAFRSALEAGAGAVDIDERGRAAIDRIRAARELLAPF